MKEKIGIILILLLAAAVYRAGSESDSRTEPCLCAESVRRQVRLEISCLNRHEAPCRTSYKIPLLQTYLPQQKVEGLKIDPEPDRYITDGWQNRYAVYEVRKIPAQREFKIVQSAVVTSYAAVFALNARAETSPEHTLFTPRLKASEREERELRRLADGIGRPFSRPLFKAEGVYDFIRQSFSFEVSPSSRSFSRMLKEKRLQCADAARLNSKLLQLNGFKARTANGFIIYNEKDGAAPHSWSEFYLSGCGFVPADPTQGRYPYTRQLFFGKYAPEIILWYRGEDGGCQMNEYDFPDRPSASPALKLTASALRHDGCVQEAALSGRFSVPDPVFAETPRSSLPFACGSDRLAGLSSSQALRFINSYPYLTEAAEPLSRAFLKEAGLTGTDWPRTPLAELVKAWIAIYKQSWEEAEKHLSSYSQDPCFKEAGLTEAALTFQYEKAVRCLSDLSGSPLSPLAAETCLQLWQDLRLWDKQSVWADYFCSLYPGEPSFILKGYAAACKSGRDKEQKKYMQLWQSTFPRDGYIYLQAGQLFLERDDYVQSLAMFKKALTMELAPEERDFCRELIAALSKRQDSH